MIVFDLACDRGHVFEGWFGSSEDYEDQRARKLLSCPLCDSGVVEKAVMAPRLTRKGNQQPALSPAPVPARTPAIAAQPEVPVASGGGGAGAGGLPPEQVKTMLEALAKAQTEMLKSSDYVGKNFVDEARAIHHGESTERPIHGEATVEQAKSLIEDGIAVTPLPFAVRRPNTEN